MLDKQKILTLAVIFSLIGISTLYIFSAQSSTRKMSVSEIDDKFLGSRIRTEGTISEISWFRYMVLFEIKEKGHEEGLTVVCDREIIETDEKRNDMISGTKVIVEGELEEYEGEINLRVDSMGELSVIKKAVSSYTQLSEILENPEWYKGMEIKVRGEIIEVDDSNQIPIVILTDLARGRYELRCEIMDGIDHYEKDIVGHPAVLKGYIRYESQTGSWKLRCTDYFEVNLEDTSR